MVQWVNYPACPCGGTRLIPSLVQLVKYLVWLKQWCRSQLWLGFSPWLRNFHILQVEITINKLMNSKMIYSLTSLNNLTQQFHS